MIAIALIWFVLAVLASPFKSKSRLPRPDVSMVSIDPDGRYDCPT